jgi:hypothetical protein
MSKQDLWVQYAAASEKNLVEEVSIEDYGSISKFKEAILTVFGISGPRSLITIYLPDGVTEIDVGDNTVDYLVGNSKETPLVVKAAVADLPQTDFKDKLRQFGLSYTQKDINYLTNHDKVGLSILMSPAYVAQGILTSARSKIRSTTRNSIGEHYSYFLDDSLNVGQGQSKSSLYYIFSKSGGVLVAKVYN